jgi:predicted nucleic acid-binding protein
MKLVVDTNIVFSALIAGGKTREAILASDLDLAVPEFFYSELRNNRPAIREKTGLSDADLDLLRSILFAEVTIVPRDEFSHRLDQAGEIMADIDPDDIPFLALAMHRDAAIWSDDGPFQEHVSVPVFTTSELLDNL